MSNITSESANLTWQPGPGGISHYYIEITGDLDLKENVTDLTLELFSLTAGGNYSVQVFPVKCGRFLNPLNTSFYTSKLNSYFHFEFLIFLKVKVKVMQNLTFTWLLCKQVKLSVLVQHITNAIIFH